MYDERRVRQGARVLPYLLGLAMLLTPVRAPAGESVAEFMARYELALDHGDPALLSQVYEDWSAEREERLRVYFTEEIAELNVEFSELRVETTGDEHARIHYLRRDRFTDARSGSRYDKRIRLSRGLRLENGRWKLLSRRRR